MAPLTSILGGVIEIQHGRNTNVTSLGVPSTGGVSEHQMIVRETPLLQPLVQALPAGQDVNFRAIHAVASRIMQAAYDGWKNAELARIAPPRHAPPP
jgi:hypothetical protein